jgi:putative colanic acid biosynthesis UDP-glucose lipid carrier transferase
MLKWKTGVLSHHQTTVSLLTRVVDALNIFVSLSCIYWFYKLEFNNIFWLLLSTTMIVFHIVSEMNSFYVSWRGETIAKELKKLSIVWIFTSIVVFALLNFVFHNTEQVSHAIFLQWVLFALISFYFYRVLIRFILRSLRKHGRNTRSVAIIGAGDLGIKMAEQLITSSWTGLQFKGFFDDQRTGKIQLELSNSKNMDAPILGHTSDIIKAAKNNEFERIYIALPMRAEAKMRNLVEQLSDTTVSVYLVPDIFMFELLHSRAEMINGMPTISIFENPMDGSNSIIKRLEDIIISSIILVLIAIPMLLISIAVMLTSKGPALFKQKRYGLDGRSINVWKFRTMMVMENSNQVTQAKRNDSRITTIGSFLRRTSLDELPQFLNVLQGGMSIVGPRPHAIIHNEEYRKLIKGYMLRHKVKPGITGWAQINGWRGETDTLEKMEKRVEFDLEYIRRWSFWFDMKIILLTIFKGFINKNAY